SSRSTERWRMNNVELDEPLTGDPKWIRFADKLKEAMTDEFKLDGITIVLRELTTEEKINEERDVLTFNHDRQLFEFGISPADHCPPAWKVADRIDSFLNPQVEE